MKEQWLEVWYAGGRCLVGFTQLLLPKVWLYQAASKLPESEHRPPVPHRLLKPKLKLHTSAFSAPAELCQAFMSGLVVASDSSCAMMLTMPSAPPTPTAGLFG